MINKYIIKNFLKKLFYITASMFVLISIINVFAIDQSKYNFSLLQIIKLVFFKTPIFIEEIFMFIVIISAITSFQDMLIHNELTIIRISGFSIIKIITPVCITVFIVGLFFITVVSPMAVVLDQKATDVKKESLYKDNPEYINNIWLKEATTDIDSSKNNRIIYIKKINLANYEMNDVTIWVFQNEGKFLKRINAKTMEIIDKEILLKNVILNSKDNINKAISELRFKTAIDKKIINQYQKNSEDISREVIYQIPKILSSLRQAGISSKAINLYFHGLLSKPFLLIVACMLAAIFGINHSHRNKKNVIYVIFGILCGLILHIAIAIIQAFGSSGILEVFITTWLVTMILFFLSSAILIKKEI